MNKKLNISQLVERYVEESLTYSTALREGILNYSALARKLKPRVEKALRRKVEEGSIVMALKRAEMKRRAALGLRAKTTTKKGRLWRGRDISFADVLKSIRVTLYSPVYDLVFPWIPSDFSYLSRLAESHHPAVFMLIAGTRTASLITDEAEIVKEMKAFLGGRESTLIDNLAVVRVLLNEKDIEKPGIVYFFSGILASAGISIVELESTYSEISFVVEKRNAVRAVELFDERSNM